MKKTLENILNQLGLIENNAVYFRNKVSGIPFIGFNSEVQKKIDIIKPDAYYVFNNQPLLLFFDLNDIDFTRDRELDIHKQVWSFDSSPIIFVLKNNEIKVYNALHYNKNQNSLEEIELSNEERTERFSFWNLQSGKAWKWLQSEYFENNKKNQQRKRVNERLFQNIREVRERLIDNHNGLTENEANSLILRLIFIRYLIDRDIKIDDNYISGDTLNQKRQSFSQLILNPNKLEELFIKLNANFNGVLFKDINIKLTPSQSTFLANVFKGEIQEQGTLFEHYYFDVFDFSIIPVEVISGIYESLIDPETRNLQSAVYTPSFLVEYVLSDTLDKYLEENETSECKIFEVAVGSGIFLVQSLRKMIDKEIELHGNKNTKLFSERIRNISKENLFGIDINPEALKVTCFSIYIALLDYQSPKDIDKYPFPNLLNENLFEANYFNTSHKYNEIIKLAQPKFILGNPPWKSNKDATHINWLRENNKVTGRYEIAQSFLLRTKDFMLPETSVALIVTSTIFFNVSETTAKFKKEFLTSYCLSKVFDLSPVRRLIFEEKNSPASIVYFSLSEGKEHLDNVVEHQSVKFNNFLKHFKILVIEKYDQKKILQKYFIENDWMFKVALYGNSLDLHLLEKLNSAEKNIKSLFKEKGIIYGDGIKSNKGNDNATHLINLPLIENKQVNAYYTDASGNRKLSSEEVFYESGRKPELFEGDHVLIKAQATNETDIKFSYVKNSVAFKSDVFGFKSLENNEKDLKVFYGLLASKLYSYRQFLVSSLGIASRAKIRLKEHISFPAIDLNKNQETQLTTLVDSFLAPFEAYYKKTIRSEELPINHSVLNKINSFMNNVYDIKGYEKDLIDYVLDVSRYQFQEGKQDLITDFTYIDEAHYRNKNSVLKNYAQIYLNEFKKVYSDEFIQVEVYPLDYFIAMNFVFSNKPVKDEVVYPEAKLNEKEVLQKLADNLSVSQITNNQDPSKNLYIQKDIKGFEKNSFYIIKPNEYKCWHRAIAWYDVAEFKEMIEDAELNNLSTVVNGF